MWKYQSISLRDGHIIQEGLVTNDNIRCWLPFNSRHQHENDLDFTVILSRMLHPAWSHDIHRD